MAQGVMSTESQSTWVDACQHHWVIEAEAGPVSSGTCKYCYSERRFNNYIGDCLKPDNQGCLERLHWQSHRHLGGERTADEPTEIESILAKSMTTPPG